MTNFNKIISKLIFIGIATLLLLINSLGCVNTPDVKETPEEPLGLLWGHKYDYIGWGPRATPAPVGDSLVIMTGDQHVSCIRTDSGSLKWQYPVPGGREAKIWRLLFDDTQFFGWQQAEREVLFALDLDTGNENWSIDSCAHWDNHGVGPAYYSPHGREAFKISLNGVMLDTVTSDQAFDSMSYYNGKVYGCFGWSPPNNPKSVGRIVCYDEETMDSLWVHEEPGGGFALCYPVFEDGVMYIGTIWGENNKVLAINAETGDLIWEQGNNDIAAIKVLPLLDKIFIEAGAAIYALEKENGQQLWRTNLANPDNTPTLSYWGGYLYVENFGTLFILDATTGEIKHGMHGPDGASVEQVSTGAGKVFVQSTEHLYAFSPYDPEKDSDIE